MKTMKELRNAESMWSIGDMSESSVVNRGNNRISHPLELAIDEANTSGYQIRCMDFVKVIPKDEREIPYESPCILLIDNESQRYAAIVHTAERAGFGRLYKIIIYEE